MQPAAAIFHEEQYFDWKVYALIGLLEAAAGVALLWWTHRADLSVLQARAWTPAFENYSFAEANGGTQLQVDVDVPPDYEQFMRETFPKALGKLKELCERRPS